MPFFARGKKSLNHLFIVCARNRDAVIQALRLLEKFIQGQFHLPVSPSVSSMKIQILFNHFSVGFRRFAAQDAQRAERERLHFFFARVAQDRSDLLDISG